jgi:hypothetical protein
MATSCASPSSPRRRRRRTWHGCRALFARSSIASESPAAARRPARWQPTARCRD